MSLASGIIFLLTTFLLYTICLAAYRLYFCAIAKFPGPKLAALTLWYEFYYDVVKRGKFSFEIEKMHEKYGTVALCFEVSTCLTALLSTGPIQVLSCG
jgi:hypothetical protein